jgi:TolB-like protein
MRLIDELKRRNVFRVGAAYVLLGWLVIQVTDTVSPALNLPEWTLGLVTWLGIIGLPFALFFAWAFELTPDGIKRETDRPDSDAANPASAQKLDIALIALLVITIGLIAWGSISDEAESDTIASNEPVGTRDSDADAAESASIAVLPLINMSADTDNAYFAGGVHEEILTNLSRIDGLRVVSRTTALRYVDSALSLRDIGHDLGVRYIVEGSVRRVNNHVRITVQLIDAASDAHLWASNYDRELVDVFAVQSEVAGAITNSLHLEIQPNTVGTLDEMPTRSVKAYDLYMKASSIDRSEPESEVALLQQRELLEAAVAEDPDFVEAWATLNEILDFSARNILQQGWFGENQAERDANFVEFRQEAQRALEMAVTLDPDNVMSLLAQASDYVREQESREYQLERKQFIDRALELDPDNAVAWLVLGWWYRIEEDYAAATPAFKKALELDPLHARIVDSALIHFRFTGDQEMTTLLFERLAQLAPEKAKNKALARVHPSAKLESLVVLFGQTADESIIDMYEAELANLDPLDRPADLDPLLFETFLRFQTSRLYQMRGDLGRLLERPQLAFPKDSGDDVVFRYLWSQADYIAAKKLGNDPDEVKAAAQNMLDAYRQLDSADSPLRPFATYAMSAAYVELNKEQADILRESLNSLDDEQLFSRISGPFYAFSIVDTDTAVQRTLQRKAQHPSWFGTDWIAVLHVVNRHLLVHPKMQAFYVEEGKWINYLAARVPEYAKYTQ